MKTTENIRELQEQKINKQISNLSALYLIITLGFGVLCAILAFVYIIPEPNQQTRFIYVAMICIPYLIIFILTSKIIKAKKEKLEFSKKKIR